MAADVKKLLLWLWLTKGRGRRGGGRLLPYPTLGFFFSRPPGQLASGARDRMGRLESGIRATGWRVHPPGSTIISQRSNPLIPFLSGYEPR